MRYRISVVCNFVYYHDTKFRFGSCIMSPLNIGWPWKREDSDFRCMLGAIGLIGSMGRLG